MAQVPLVLMNDLSFNVGNEVDQLDISISDGNTKTIPVVNKSVSSVGGRIQAGNTQYVQASKQFVRSTGSVILNSAPASGTVIIVPGIIRFVLRAYDQDAIQGYTDGDPNVSYSPFWICDPLTISINTYLASFGQAGIRVQMVDNDPDNGAAASWVQLGYAVPATGAKPSTWKPAGDPIYFPPIQAQDVLSADIAAGATSLTVGSGAQFVLPTLQNTVQYIRLDDNGPNQEDVQVTGISGNTISVETTSFSHVAGASVFQLAYGGWAKLTLPTGIGPQTLYDVSTDMLYDIDPR